MLRSAYFGTFLLSLALQKFEVGKAFKNGTFFYAKPEVSIDPGEFNREWAIEAGLGFVF